MKQYRPSLFEQTKTPFSRTQYMSPQSTKCNTIEGSSSKSSFDQFLIKQQSTMDDYTRERNEIFSAIIPQIDRLRQKEEHLNSIMTEASCYYEEYKKQNSHLEEESKNYQNKKEKLKYVYHSLYMFKNNLLKKEKELQEREQKLKEYENVLKQNEIIIEENSKKFETFVEEKTKELKAQANEVKEIKEQNEKYNIELLRKEEEICLREEKLKFNENNL